MKKQNRSPVRLSCWRVFVALLLALTLSNTPRVGFAETEEDLESFIESEELEDYESPEELEEMIAAEEVTEEEETEVFEDEPEEADDQELAGLEDELADIEDSDEVAGVEPDEETKENLDNKAEANSEKAEEMLEDDAIAGLDEDDESDKEDKLKTRKVASNEDEKAEEEESDELLDELAAADDELDEKEEDSFIEDELEEFKDDDSDVEAELAQAQKESREKASEATTADSYGSSEVMATIANLQFAKVGKESRITVTFDGEPRYQKFENPSVKQTVFIFENTRVPNKFQRAYDTSEFISPVALFTLLQMPGEDPPLSKLIVQMREFKAPSITVANNRVLIDFPAPDQVPITPKVGLKRSDEKEAVEENIYASGKIFKGKRVQRLEIKNSEVQDVLRLIAKTSGYNIVIGDDVTGKVGTLSLENVPWDQVFTLILQTKKLGYVRQGNVIRVGTLASLKAEKEAALANEQSRLKVEPLRTVLIPVSYAKAEVLQARAKTFLSTRGSVDVDDRTNTLIVRDVREVIARVQKLIVALDTQPARVSISAKVVEMLSSFSRSLGFGTVQFGNDPTSSVNFQTSYGGDVGGVAATQIQAADFLNLQATFEIGELENKVRTLANPTVTAINNTAATVNQSISFLVPDIVVIGGVATSTFKQITANLTLQVTPIVSGDGSVFMQVSVNNDIPRGQGASLTIDSRSITTEVLVENGDTAVIGGIFQNTVNRAKTGIPFLMRIPILGFFFTASNSKEEVKNEIVIFLTPKILNADKAFKRAL